jgi:hypothetical protein
MLMSKEFIQDNKQVNVIIEALTIFFKQENYHLLDSLKIINKMEGWEKLMEFLCVHNELMDKKVINMPNF